jgi:ABC-type transport system involved in multi-copper enzyme maturation permease subunit
MIASFRAEAVKMRKRWANWILAGIFLAFIVLLVYVIIYVALTGSSRNVGGPIPASVLKRSTFPENLVPTVLDNAASIGAAIMIILGALSTASEYGWLTVQTILIQRPGRTAVLLGKVIALAITTLLICIAVMASSAAISAVLVSIDGGLSSWPSATTLLKGFGALLLEMAVWTAFGMFLGIAFRSTAAAIGGGLTYLFVGEGLLGGLLLRDTPVVKELLKFLPGVNAGAVNAAFPLTFRNPNAATHLVDAQRGVVTLVAYLLLFTLLSIVIFGRREVAGS